MTPMTADQRARAMAALSHQGSAEHDQVLSALSDALSVGGHNHRPLIAERLRRAGGHVPAIVRRLLDAEAEATALRRVLGEAGALAYENPDGGLSAGDIKQLAAAVGIDIAEDIEHAYHLRMADATGGAW